MEVELFVPGRLCILGEHTDWAAQYRPQNDKIPCGYTLVCATNEGLHARVSTLSTPVVRFEHIVFHGTEPESRVFEVPMVIDDLLTTAKAGGFFCYIAGTAGVILQHAKFKLKQQSAAPLPAGIYINNHHTTLPMRKGLSSSAAVCVLVATAFSNIFDLDFSQEEIMELAFQGEMSTPSRCGRMDQCVVMGPGAVGLMQFESDHCSLRRLSVPATASTQTGNTNLTTAASPETEVSSAFGGLFFVVVDLKSFKNTMVILQELNDCFPHPANDTQALIYNYVEGVVNIAQQSVEAIEAGDVYGLGAQMTRAQALFDANCLPNCPSELSSPRLHALMGDAVLREMCVAVKGVGSQGDGSAQLLCATADLQQKALAYVREKYGMDGFYLTIQ